MNNQAAETYYTDRAPRLLRGFDRFSKRLKKSLTARYGDAFAIEVTAVTRTEFERIIPELPYIGGRKNYFTPVMLVNGWLVALYRAMKERGKSAEEVIAVCFEISDGFFRTFPSFVLRFGGKAAFSGFVKNALKKQAAMSQERRYSGDFVYNVREGEDGEMTLEFSECAVNKFYEAQRVQELKPFCNFFDVAYSRVMNMGLDASETIGQGCRTCKLRYKHGRETVVPPWGQA